MISIRRTWDWLGSRSAIRVVQVMVLIITATVVWLAREQAATVACNTRYNTASSEYNRDRSDVASVEREAMDRVMRAVQAGDRAAVAAAVDLYLEARTKAEERRRESPVLPPPADLCS